jgi:hypothetical protein
LKILIERKGGGRLNANFLCGHQFLLISLTGAGFVARVE